MEGSLEGGIDIEADDNKELVDRMDGGEGKPDAALHWPGAGGRAHVGYHG